jgi:hypothetical protein
MRRLLLPALVGLVVLLVTASPAPAFGLIYHHHKHPFMYAPVAPVAPVAPAAPVSPQQILGWVQLAQQGAHILLDTSGQQPPRPPAPECKVSPEVFTSLDASRKNLASAVKGTNALMELVKTGDKRVADQFQGKKPISMKDKGPAKGSSGGGGGGSGSAVNPADFGAADPKANKN